MTLQQEKSPFNFWYVQIHSKDCKKKRGYVRNWLQSWNCIKTFPLGQLESSQMQKSLELDAEKWCLIHTYWPLWSSYHVVTNKPSGGRCLQQKSIYQQWSRKTSFVVFNPLLLLMALLPCHNCGWLWHFVHQIERIQPWKMIRKSFDEANKKILKTTREL